MFRGCIDPCMSQVIFYLITMETIIRKIICRRLLIGSEVCRIIMSYWNKMKASSEPNLSKLVNRHVLIRSNFDGWFYPGRIKLENETGTMTVETSSGLVETRSPNEIVLAANSKYLTEDSFCVAKANGAFEKCYGPAQVIDAKQTILSIQFYDGTILEVLRENAYPINEKSFESFSQFIKLKERECRGFKVLGLSAKEGLFYKGKIVKKSPDTRMFDVWFANGEKTKLCWSLMIQISPAKNHSPFHFSDHSSNNCLSETLLKTDERNPVGYCGACDATGLPLVRGDAVIAPFPGSLRPSFCVSKVFGISRNNELDLVFQIGSTKSMVPASKCYWLPKTSYREIVHKILQARGSGNNFLKPPPTPHITEGTSRSL